MSMEGHIYDHHSLSRARHILSQSTLDLLHRGHGAQGVLGLTNDLHYNSRPLDDLLSVEYLVH